MTSTQKLLEDLEILAEMSENDGDDEAALVIRRAQATIEALVLGHDQTVEFNNCVHACTKPVAEYIKSLRAMVASIIPTPVDSDGYVIMN